MSPAHIVSTCENLSDKQKSIFMCSTAKQHVALRGTPRTCKDWTFRSNSLAMLSPSSGRPPLPWSLTMSQHKDLAHSTGASCSCHCRETPTLGSTLATVGSIPLAGQARASPCPKFKFCRPFALRSHGTLAPDHARSLGRAAESQLPDGGLLLTANHAGQRTVSTTHSGAATGAC